MKNMPDDQRRAVTRAALACLIMGSSAALAQKMLPRRMLTEVYGKLDLEGSIPIKFNGWHQDTSLQSGVVNPEQASLLNRIYSQILSRTYLGPTGERVMLSIAYGEDQRDGIALHYPEVCYPAQGFQLISNTPIVLQIGATKIPARRLETKLNEQRYEPITYWTMIGTNPVRGGIAKKIAEIKYGLRDEIPDGLLFRVSTIDQDSKRAFHVQNSFIQSLLAAVAPAPARRLAGISD